MRAFILDFLKIQELLLEDMNLRGASEFSEEIHCLCLSNITRMTGQVKKETDL